MKTENKTESMNTKELDYKENKKYRFKKQRQRNWRKKLTVSNESISENILNDCKKNVEKPKDLF